MTDIDIDMPNSDISLSHLTEFLKLFYDDNLIDKSTIIGRMKRYKRDNNTRPGIMRAYKIFLSFK